MRNISTPATSRRRDHIAVLLYAIEEGTDPIPAHVAQLALSAIASVGFDPAARAILDDETAEVEESGMQWAGNDVATSEFNYLRYVRARKQWDPETTSRAVHLRDLRDAALNPKAGLALCNKGTEEAVLDVVSFASPADPDRGFTFLAVDPASRHWTEGFRGHDVDAALAEHRWKDVQWLRAPTES